MTPDTQLSGAVERLRKDVYENYKLPSEMVADLRTVLAELERLTEENRLVLMANRDAIDWFEQTNERRKELEAELAALRSSPRFTKEDLDFLAQCKRDETNGTHGFINEHAAAKFRDLADRISQTLEKK